MSCSKLYVQYDSTFTKQLQRESLQMNIVWTVATSIKLLLLQPSTVWHLVC